MKIENAFIDTSAFYALMDRSDSYHEKAKKLWGLLLDEEVYLKTTNYIIVHTSEAGVKATLEVISKRVISVVFITVS